MDKPLVSVIMAVFNGQRFVSQAIESVLNQQYNNFELIIIDDCSTDDSSSIIKSYKDKRIRSFRNEENENYTYTLNRGISHAKGKYIAVLDQDDQWFPEKLEKQIKYLEQNPNVGACFTWVNVVDENNKPRFAEEEGLVTLFHQKNRTRFEWLHDLLLFGNMLCHPSVVYRTDALLRNGCYDISLIQLSDYEMYLRILSELDIHIICEQLMAYRRTHDSVSLSLNKGIPAYRSRHEFSIVVPRYITNMSGELFYSVFKEELDNYNDDPKLLNYYKGKLLYEKYDDEMIKYAGTVVLRDCFCQKDVFKLLTANSIMSQKDYYDITAYKDINTYYEELNAYNKHNEAHLATLKNKVRSLESNVQVLEKNRQNMTRDNQEMQRQNNELQNIVSAMENSDSWKLTKPLRGTTHYIKKIIGKTAKYTYHFLRKVKHRSLFTRKKHINWPPKKYLDKQETVDLLDENSKRVVIYHFFDKDGKVDRYVLHFLRELKTVSSKIVFVSNGVLLPDAKSKVDEFVDEIIVRDNEGFDAWGMKKGFEHLNSEELNDYDELLMVNSTFFGPFCDLKEIFDTMADRKIDFWGITSHPGFDYDPFNCNPYGYIPEHVQTYWVCIRKRMFTSPAFKMFWDQLPVIKDYNEAVGYYETVFTKYFSDCGFIWDTWINRKDYELLTDNPLIATPVEALRDMKCPIVKWRAFFQDYDYLTTFTGQHTAMYLMDYLEKQTNYPIEYVWEYLIRTRHMSDLVRNLHLAEILDSHRYDGLLNEEDLKKHPIALFVHLYDPSMADEIAEYASNMPEHADIWISTTSEEKKQSIQESFANMKQKVSIRVCPNRGRDVSALLASFNDVVMNYEFICVTHDKKTSHLKPETIGEGFAYMGYENILSSRQFVKNVISSFCEKPYIGLLYTPDPNHAAFATHIGLEWGNNFINTKRLADELKLNVPIDEKHPPCAPFGSNFWIRTKSLAPLYNKQWTYEDFPKEPLKDTDGTIMHAVERIYPYCAQNNGYYSALLMTNDYSSIELGNLGFYSESYAHVCSENNIYGNYLTVRDTLNNSLGYVSPSSSGDTSSELLRNFNLVHRITNKLRRTLTKWAG